MLRFKKIRGWGQQGPITITIQTVGLIAVPCPSAPSLIATFFIISPASSYSFPLKMNFILYLSFFKRGKFLPYTIFMSFHCFALTQWKVSQRQDPYLILSVPSPNILPLICNHYISVEKWNNDSSNLGLIAMQLSGIAGRGDLIARVKALFCCEI